MAEYKYKAICHTKCYWLETLWEPGEVYEGDVKPIKHFSVDGKTDEALPPPNPGMDPRSNIQLRGTLEKEFEFKAPSKWTRKQLWSKLHELETAAARDAALTPESRKFQAPCGFESKSNAGANAHARSCVKCKALTGSKENDNGDSDKHLQPGT